MSWKLAGSYFETYSCNRSTQSKIDASRIQYDGETEFSTWQFSWAA
jgi:hypothetical protein